LLSGDKVELWTGEQLEHKEVAHPGDYLYIPAGVPHVAVNRSETPAIFVAARTDPKVSLRTWVDSPLVAGPIGVGALRRRGSASRYYIPDTQDIRTGQRGYSTAA
jgi:hypothetical protein